MAKSSTAIGPDGMSTLHLKKPAQGAINHLTNIFNMSISTGQIPVIWHKAILILSDPKTRQGQQHRQELETNYSTVTSSQNDGKAPAAHNTASHAFPPCKHCLRPIHLTCTAPSTITADIAAGISRKEPSHRTVLVALDLTPAFNNVDHPHMLDCVLNTNLPATIRRRLYNYMQNRRAEVHFLQIETKSRKVKTGVVQRGVLSPAIFNFYLTDFPTPHPNIKLIKHTDDITIYSSGPVVADLINGLNIYPSQVLNYINNNEINVLTAKSTVTLFTPDTHEHHFNPQVNLADQVLLLEKKHKFVGVTLDTQLTFTQHCNNIAVKVQLRNNVLKALAGSTWRCDKETLLTTYQAIGRSILLLLNAIT